MATNIQEYIDFFQSSILDMKSVDTEFAHYSCIAHAVTCQCFWNSKYDLQFETEFNINHEYITNNLQLVHILEIIDFIQKQISKFHETGIVCDVQRSSLKKQYIKYVWNRVGVMWTQRETDSKYLQNENFCKKKRIVCSKWKLNTIALRNVVKNMHIKFAEFMPLYVSSHLLNLFMNPDRN